MSHQGTWVTSVNLLCPPPPRCCLGPFRVLLTAVCVLCLPPSLWRVVPSTPLDLTGTVAPAVDFQSLYQTASTRFSIGKLPLSVPPPFFLCPVIEVFLNSVMFSMQNNYFKNCFCKYLCEYFSIVFDNIQHFHDLVIAFAGVFKIP